MWCPNCKNEYVAGITKCSDCNVNLVASLDDVVPENFVEEYPKDESLTAPGSSTNQADEPDISHTHAYISKRTKGEDLKSTAYTFTFVGGLGILLLILFATGVLPLQIAQYTKVMICVVMGVMFAVFFLVGIRSFAELKNVLTAADAEDALFEEIVSWFTAAYSKDTLNQGIDLNQSGEQLYFLRYDVMSALISEKYADLEESFADHVIESLYNNIFSV